MAKIQENASVFRNDIESSGQNSEKLNEYIRIGSISGYFLIGALALIIAAFLIWGFTGTIPVTTQEHGAIVETDEMDVVLCFIDVNNSTGSIPKDAMANFTTADGISHSGRVVYMSPTPVSTGVVRYLFTTNDMDYKKEVYEEEELATLVVNEWMLDYLLGDSAYHYLLIIASDERLPGYQYEVVNPTIITEEVRPVSFLFK